MQSKRIFTFLFLFPIFSISTVFPYALQPAERLAVVAQPLSTDGRWIVDGHGRRVKLACVNWASHLEVMVAEGLSKQPVDVISKKIVAMGFNCVRLTWPLFLVTNDSLATLPVRQSFQRIGLIESIAGLEANNPSIVDVSLITAFQAVVSSLGDNGVMVILDNHISKPGWCCSSFDGNGFFGDQYFNPDLWIKGLSKMATLFKNASNVVGMSLRNELRGPKQNVIDWYRYMQKGAEAVHQANPNVLVVFSGLSFDKDLSFLGKQQLNLTFTRKAVFEAHWYAFSDGQAWRDGNPNQVCGRVVDNLMRMAGFLLDQGWPLFISEYGIDLRGTNVNDNRYFNCFLGVAAELDLDWALWTIAGSYYLREGVIGMNEYYGLLGWNWCEPRNSSFLERISTLQSPLQGPGLSLSTPHKIIFHPLTGLCVLRSSLFEPLKLGSCSDSEPWGYTTEKTLMLKGTYFCLQAQGMDQPVKLGLICSSSGSQWEPISDSKMHLSTKLNDCTTVCLDVNSNNEVISTSCKCLSKDDTCNPASQWFKVVNSTRSSCPDTSKSLV
ncbi:hypothetical protein Ancab_021269 [Ancistrocladus abbreviatus]